jgi:hypothetical protein
MAVVAIAIIMDSASKGQWCTAKKSYFFSFFCASFLHHKSSKKTFY